MHTKYISFYHVNLAGRNHFGNWSGDQKKNVFFYSDAKEIRNIRKLIKNILTNKHDSVKFDFLIMFAYFITDRPHLRYYERRIRKR